MMSEEKSREISQIPPVHPAIVEAQKSAGDRAAKESMTGECMPLPIGVLKCLREIEGYVVTDNFSIAIFKGEIKDDGVKIPPHMRKVFKEEDIQLVVIQKHGKETEQST